MITKRKPTLILQTVESDFINRVCITCGHEFVSIYMQFDWQSIRDFIVGRKKPRPIDMTNFIAALGEFNRLSLKKGASV